MPQMGPPEGKIQAIVIVYQNRLITIMLARPISNNTKISPVVKKLGLVAKKPLIFSIFLLFGSRG